MRKFLFLLYFVYSFVGFGQTNKSIFSIDKKIEVVNFIDEFGTVDSLSLSFEKQKLFTWRKGDMLPCNLESEIGCENGLSYLPEINSIQKISDAKIVLFGVHSDGSLSSNLHLLILDSIDLKISSWIVGISSNKERRDIEFYSDDNFKNLIIPKLQNQLRDDNLYAFDIYKCDFDTITPMKRIRIGSKKLISTNEEFFYKINIRY